MMIKFFFPPQFENDVEKSRLAKLLHQIIMASWAFPILAFLISNINPATSRILFPVGAVLTVILSAAMLLNRSGRTTPASYVLIGMLLVTMIYLNYISAGEVRPLLLLTVIAIMAGGLLLGSRGAMGVAILLAAENLVIVSLNAQGVIVPQNAPPTTTQGVIVITVSYLLIGFLLQLSISRTQVVVDQIREREKELKASNRDLQSLSESLENRVAARTLELNDAIKHVERRATQFRTVSQITQKIASERDLDTLLSIIAEVISNQFNYYHVGIYLNDDIQEYTILGAANSEGGKRMLERGHKLPISNAGIVGYVAKTGVSRIAADITETDEIYFSSPDLPATRSELALPLKSGVQVIGVLDVQSTEANAFDETDAEALTALANQITIAIQNTRLFAETQTALAESQLLYGTVVKQTWKTNMQANPQVGYRYMGIKPVPIKEEIYTIEMREALDNDNIAVTHPGRRKNENALAVPLKLRESTIGVINIKFPMNTEISEDEIDLILETTRRVALALENASLLEESQRRARREQTISEMSAKIGASAEIETILKTAIHELSAHISSAQIAIEIGSEEEG